MKYLFFGIALLTITPGFIKKTVARPNGSVASAHPLATRAGLDILWKPEKPLMLTSGVHLK